DLAFQPGSFPNEAKEAWGFAVCTGFFYMRPCTATRRIAERVQQRFDGSDQRTLNAVLLDEFDITWSNRPSGWETCLEDGG
ncbi:hypothetical protein, partial [Staphylococcus pasteuri_A]